MIVTSKVRAQADVDPQAVEGGLDAIRGMMRKAVLHEGESIGAFIKPESVWFRVFEPADDTMLVRIHATWSPDPLQGCQLRGGALDGQIVKVPRQKDGKPPEQIRFPDPGIPQYAYEAHPSPPQNTMYTLAGIDSSEDRWVYQASN